MNDPLHRRSHDDTAATAPVRHDRRALVVTVILAAVVCGIIGVAQSGSGKDTAAASSIAPASDLSGIGADDGAGDASGAAATTLPAGAVVLDPATGATLAPTTVPGATDAATAGTDVGQDLDGGADTTGDACTMDRLSAALGDTGASVTCLQAALVTAGYYTGAVTGTFDDATYSAVKAMQTEKDLFVDGKVGRETALALGIWPDEASLVVRTPPPAAGAVDLLGYTLSSVAVSGDDPKMPPLPDGSGSGKRLVYDRAGQRVWAVDKNDRVVRSWLVSGSKYGNETPGVHEVYSRSEASTAWNGKAILPHMVRWLKTKIGNIGFHGIPRHVSDGSRYQTDAELGTRLSGGCQRQADLDADFVWDFAQIGTTVVVL